MNAMESVSNALGIDRVDMCGKMILIEERHGIDANFVINSIISNALKKNHGICLVLFHNTFSHYHNVGMRLGYNLTSLLEKGTITTVEPIKILTSNVNDLCEDSLDIKNSILVDNTERLRTNTKDGKGMDIVRKLFRLLKDKYDEAARHSESVLIIIDDLSHLFDLGLSLKESMYYVRYIRSLVQLRPRSQLCVSIHTYHKDLHGSVSNVASNGLKYMAHLVIVVEPLVTGYSSDASGKIMVCWKIDSVRSAYHWAEKITYLYKLQNWQVKIFAPGTIVLI